MLEYVAFTSRVFLTLLSSASLVTLEWLLKQIVHDCANIFKDIFFEYVFCYPN